MRTITFFNAKGGVGKTVHTTMFASFLRYNQRAKVAVIDLENPTPRVLFARRSEERLLSESDSWLSRYLAKHPAPESPYDIFDLSGSKPMYTKEYLKDLSNRAWDFIAHKDYDYVLFDFPAMFMEASPAFTLITSGIMDLTVVPIDVDNATRREGILTARQVLDNEQRVVAFWNNVSAEDIRRSGYLESGEVIFRQNGVEVLPERVKTFQKAKRDSDERLFVKSTVCWPERYVEMACPELPKLYMDIKNRLDRL